MGHGASIKSDLECRFDPNASCLVSSDMSDGFNLFSHVPSSRLAFIRFVKSGTWLDSVNTEKVFSHGKLLSVLKEQATGEISRRIEQYVLSSNAKPDLEQCLSKRKLRLPSFNKAHSSKNGESMFAENGSGRTHSKDRLTASFVPTFLSDHLENHNYKKIQEHDSGEDVPDSGDLSADAATIGCDDVKRLNEQFLFNDEQMKYIIFAYLFPMFLHSEAFTGWMAKKPIIETQQVRLSR